MITIANALKALPCICLLVVGTAHAESADETLKALPAPVQKTIRAEKQDRTLVKIETKAKDGHARYKVVMTTANGMQKRLVVDAGGALLRVKNDVALDTLPAAVRSAVDANTKGAKFVRSTKVTHDGKIEYEVEYDVSGRSKVLLIDPAGKMEKVEEVVAIATIPAAAKAEVDKSVGTGKLIKVEAITETGKPTFYEAQYEVGGHKSEVKLASDGKVLGRE